MYEALLLLKEHKTAPRNDVINKSNFIFQFFFSLFFIRERKKEKLSQKVFYGCFFSCKPIYDAASLSLSLRCTCLRIFFLALFNAKNTTFCLTLDDDRCWVWREGENKNFSKEISSSFSYRTQEQSQRCNLNSKLEQFSLMTKNHSLVRWSRGRTKVLHLQKKSWH